MSKIYLASSWRNEAQPIMVEWLRGRGHEVYDFRNPGPGKPGFSWAEIDLEWFTWTTPKFLTALSHPVADHGFALDANAMQWADTFVLLLPCGRSAHLELGWAIGAGKRTAIYLPPEKPFEPELMYKLAGLVTDDLLRLFRWLGHE